MGLVKTRRLAAMQKQTTYANATVVRDRAIHLRQGYGGLKAGMKPPVGKGACEKLGKGAKASANIKRS